MLRLLCALLLVLPSLAFAQPGANGAGPGTAGNSAANPAFVSVVQNGASTNVANVSPPPQTGTWTYSGTGSTTLVGPIDMTAGGYNSLTFSDINYASGTFNIQVADDPASDTWVSAPCNRYGDFLFLVSFGYADTVSCGTGGARYIRIYISGYTSGTDNGYYNASVSQPLVFVNSPIVKTNSLAVTVAGATVGTSSAQALAGATRNHIRVQNVSASAIIYCSWGGTGTINGSNSFALSVNQGLEWGPTTSGGVPTVALNCIASAASSPLYIEYN